MLNPFLETKGKEVLEPSEPQRPWVLILHHSEEIWGNSAPAKLTPEESAAEFSLPRDKGRWEGSSKMQVSTQHSEGWVSGPLAPLH